MPSIDSAHPKKVDGMLRNQWSTSSGFGGRLAPDSLVAFDRITHSDVPYLLQSSLMALENWLVDTIDYSDLNTIEWLFDYILRNSNSIMPTAVLASVATGFPSKIGKSALPLLRTADLYFLDSRRTIQELGGNEINWFGLGLNRDILSEIYIEDRRKAALRAWRKEHLETLIIKLQFSQWREDALIAIDKLRASTSTDELMRFLFHRIDSRGWNPVEDKENNRIIFEPKDLEPDLEKIQKETQEKTKEESKYTFLFLWAKHTFRHEPLENDNYASWKDAFIEAKELAEKIKADKLDNMNPLYYGGLVTASAVFIRDHSSELTEETISWCIEFVISTIKSNADTDNSLAVADATDFDGAAAAASIIPILFDFASDDDEKSIVKSLIVTALTHVNENVRHCAADGIRDHLWQRNQGFARNCIIGAIEYARFEKAIQPEKRSLIHLDAKDREVAITKLQARISEFRDRFARGEFSSNPELITLRTHSPWHILTPCLMIPDDSTRSEHIALFSQMLALFYENEQNKHNYHSDNDKDLEFQYNTSLDFCKRFGKYLYHLQKPGITAFTDQLRKGCEIAPDFMQYLLLCVAVEAEKDGRYEVYWQLLKELSQKLQEIAIEISQHDSEVRQYDERNKLIRSVLKLDIDWQKIDFENPDIIFGKELLIEFVTNAGKNPDVFEAMTKLMYHFPSTFFEPGIYILSKHQREQGGVHLLSGMNTSFYLERSIQRFLQHEQTGYLPRKMYESCFNLLDAIVETASSRAYYLREHLIRSRKIK